MSTLRDTLRRIKTIKNTAKITSAMKMIAATHLRQSQKLIHNAEPFYKNLEASLKRVFPLIDEHYTNPLLTEKTEVKNVAVMVISSDKGFCGSFNSNIIKYTQNFIKNLAVLHPNADFQLITLGSKVTKFFTSQMPDKIFFSQKPIYGKYKFAFTQTIIHKVTDSFLNGQFDKVYFLYTDFVNILKQEPKYIQLLPLQIDIQSENQQSNYIFEPNKNQILDDLIPTYIDEIFWRIFLVSNAALRASEMMAMDLATINANNFIKFLELQYNKERQQIITTEMLEIVSGAEALK